MLPKIIRGGILFLTVFSFGIFTSEVFAQVLSPERRAELERELQSIEAQIGAQQKILDDRKQQSQTLERDIAILNAEISRAKLSIKARNLSIEKLSDEIKQKTKVIGVLSSKLDREKESLSQIVRKTNEIDDYSIAEFALTKKTISDFFIDVDSFQEVKKSLQTSLDVVNETKVDTEDQKANLEDKRREQLELLQLQELEKKKTEQQEKEKREILKQSKGLEKEYQKVLSEKQQTAAQIRRQLFELRGSDPIPFEKAYEYAKEVEAKLGIRPAFLLGIIAEESNLGQNVGTGNWRVDMHPTRDQPIFEKIANKLGANPDTLPVSKKPWYGWGGAMGPAQFIPSTWVLYEDRVVELTGSSVANPWNPRDAFFASGLLLKDNGAAKGTRAAERLAALRYLAGWANASKPAYAFYGNEVMDLADKWQKQIDILNR
jgi:peptidoglycan hydrolase CwlO-like protein